MTSQRRVQNIQDVPISVQAMSAQQLERAVLHVNLNYNYTDRQNTHQNLDPVFDQDAIGRLDLNIALEFNDWGVELLGRNITDEEFVTYSGNTPLSGTFGADTVYGFIAPPAIWTLRAYYSF